MLIRIPPSPDIQAAIQDLRASTNGLAARMNADTASPLSGEWVSQLNARASGVASTVLAGSAFALASATGFRLVAANSPVPLSHGLVPSEQYAGFEWGARTRRMTIATHSRKGRPYNVTKMVNRQFPYRVGKDHGRVVMKSASETGTKLVGVWVRQLVADAAVAAHGRVVPR